ncbi:MAG: hypothetical protein GXY08_06825, partial [Ruminococcus sp.]|nr:hypothetical protein [Ruminococcus sp.]
MEKSEFDLDILENADDETVDRMSAEHKALPDSDIKRLYAKSEKMYRERVSSSEQTADVSGVEKYRRPVWHRVLAIASALLIVAGAGAGGALLFKNMKDKPDNKLAEAETQAKVEAEVTTAEEVADTQLYIDTITVEDASNDPETVDTQKQFRELQLHEVITVDTMDEAYQLADDNYIQTSLQDRYGIDVEHYVNEVLNADELNTLEIKSFIYHMMLNSVDYYNTIKGTAVCDDGISFSRMEVQSDINAQEAFVKYTDNEGNIELEEYFLDGKRYTLYNNNELKDKCLIGYRGVEEISDTVGHPDDNYRRIDINSNDRGLTVNREDVTKLCCRAGELAMPQAIATYFMRDFEKWQIDELSESNGFNTVKISGTPETGRSFKA